VAAEPETLIKIQYMDEHHSEHSQASRHASGGPMAQLEGFFDEYLGHKAPQLPPLWRERLVAVIRYRYLFSAFNRFFQNCLV
jgi:hypothetical protein